MENVYFPPAEPKNITDLATRTRNLDQEGLMSLRQMKSYLRRAIDHHQVHVADQMILQQV